jgi:hypothetical protein
LCVHFDNTGGERNNKEDIMDGERERERERERELKRFQRDDHHHL